MEATSVYSQSQNAFAPDFPPAFTFSTANMRRVAAEIHLQESLSLLMQNARKTRLPSR